MSHLSNAREAKEFLVAKIVEEAQRENVTLSEVEEKMLYFSESGWTLPDIMDINDQFDEQYDQAEYEKKIVRLIKNATQRIRKQNPEEYKDWLAATQVLGREDHYISVMTGQVLSARGSRPQGDIWRLMSTAVLIVAGFVFLAFLVSKLIP